MELAKFRFLGKFHRMPEGIYFPNSVIRNALDWSFRGQLCVSKNQLCPDCELRQHCLFPKIFIPPLTIPANPNYPAKSPFIWEWFTPKDLRKASSLDFEWHLTLFGSWIDYLPYFVSAVEKLTQTGIGRRNDEGRATFDLIDICAKNTSLYDSQNQTLIADIPKKSLSWETEPSPEAKTLVFHLDSPLRFSNSMDLEQVRFQRLVWMAIQRLNSLWAQFKGVLCLTDTTPLLEEAKAVKISEFDLKWKREEHYSPRQGSVIWMGGWLGKMVFRGNLTPFLPLFELVRQVHIGKSTSFGYGKFHYEIIE